MGNCVRKCHGELAAAGDAEHCAAADKKTAALVEDEGEEALHGGGGKGGKAPEPVTEVKIRITRKQLEELLRRLNADGAEGGGAVIAEMLCLTSSCNFRHRDGHDAATAAAASGQQWRPALQSIPE